jgi:hypothetical protein
MSPKSSDPEDPLERLPLLHDPDELELREPLLLLLLRELLDPPLKELPPPGRMAAWALVTIDARANAAASDQTPARRNRPWARRGATTARRLMRAARRAAR